MLSYGTRLYPFRIAGPLPFEQLSGVFYYYKGDSDDKGDHWLLVEATDADAADKILSDKGLWAFLEQSEDGMAYAGMARMVQMQRHAAKVRRLDIWDDGFKDESSDSEI